jgi:hypothetical protein
LGCAIPAPAVFLIHSRWHILEQNYQAFEIKHHFVDYSELEILRQELNNSKTNVELKIGFPKMLCTLGFA